MMALICFAFTFAIYLLCHDLEAYSTLDTAVGSQVVYATFVDQKPVVGYQYNIIKIVMHR